MPGERCGQTTFPGAQQVGCVAKTHRDAERCVIARSTHPIGSRPSPAGAWPGPARPLPGTKAICRANLRLGHRAPGRGRRRARTVSGCVNSAFLNISIQFTVHLFRPWIPNSARHRRWTPMIQRGRARRTISAGSWFGLWSPDPPSSTTAALPAPDRWRVTWRPPLSRMAGPGDPRRTSPRPSARHLETSGRPNGGVGRPCPNQRNQSERKGNMRQPQLCSMPGSRCMARLRLSLCARLRLSAEAHRLNWYS